MASEYEGMTEKDVQEVVLLAKEMISAGRDGIVDGEFTDRIQQLDELQQQMLSEKFDWNTIAPQKVVHLASDSDYVDYDVPNDIASIAPNVAQDEIVNQANRLADSLMDILSEVGRIEGYDAIRQMEQEGSTQHCQTEWPGWYLEHLIAQHEPEPSSQVMDGTSERCNIQKNTNGKTVHIDWDLGRYLCDTKVMSEDETDPFLNDLETTVQVIERDGILFFAIIKADYEFDPTKQFDKWHKQWRKDHSKSSRQSSSDGTKSRKSKLSFTPRRIEIYALRAEDLTDLPQNGRGKVSFHKKKQGKNSNGKPRPPKLGLKLQNVQPIVQKDLT